MSNSSYIIWPNKVTNREGLEKLISLSAGKCPAFEVPGPETRNPTYCPLAVGIMKLLDLEHPVWEGPYKAFGCDTYWEGNCSLREPAETTALKIACGEE